MERSTLISEWGIAMSVIDSDQHLYDYRGL